MQKRIDKRIDKRLMPLRQIDTINTPGESFELDIDGVGVARVYLLALTEQGKTWMMVLPKKMPMQKDKSQDQTKENGWENSFLRKKADEIYEMLPMEIKERIIPALNRQIAFGNTGVSIHQYMQETVDHIWLFDEDELVAGKGERAWMWKELYSDPEYRYWLRSAVSSTSFRDTDSSGNSHYVNASSACGVALGFFT